MAASEPCWVRARVAMGKKSVTREPGRAVARYARVGAAIGVRARVPARKVVVDVARDYVARESVRAGGLYEEAFAGTCAGHIVARENVAVGEISRDAKPLVRVELAARKDVAIASIFEREAQAV